MSATHRVRVHSTPHALRRLLVVMVFAQIQVLGLYPRRLMMKMQQILNLLLQALNLAILFSHLVLEFEDLLCHFYEYVSRISFASAGVGHVALCALFDAVVAAFFILVAGKFSTLDG